MELLKLPELNKTFFIRDREYKINFIKEGSNRFSADPHTKEGTYVPQLNERFMIDNASFIVTYVHTGKNRITAQPLSSGY